MGDQYDELLRIKYESLIVLKERGYVIPSEESDILNKNINLRDFKSIYTRIHNDVSHPFYEYFTGNSPRVSMSNIYYKDGSKCLVYFAPSHKSDKKISDIAISKFCQLIINQDVNEAILISAAPSSTAIDSLCFDVKKKTNETHGVFIQFFEDSELKYNPLLHDMVPKHRIISKKERDVLEYEDKLDFRKFPQISSLDPVCKRLGAKNEDVIEVIRKIIFKDCLLDEELAYRYVYTPAIVKSKK
jgi:DNA-directed RNA polymerase subunit H